MNFLGARSSSPRSKAKPNQTTSQNQRSSERSKSRDSAGTLSSQGRAIICRCNNVNAETISNAIQEGCATMNEIFDATTAGVGPCGGSCRRKIVPMLEEYLRQQAAAQAGPAQSPRDAAKPETSAVESAPSIKKAT